MRFRILPLVVLGALLAACSPADETENNTEHTYEATSTQAYSKEKIDYCESEENKESCSCQFDVMDPILTNAIGENWSTKPMEEKDFGAYVSAVESAVSQCS